MTTDTAAPAPVPEGAGAASKGSPRERLLDAAAQLFYAEGVRAPTDALCAAAGVSKRSMYKLFASKDAVLAAALERGVPALTRRLLPPPDSQLGPRERILYVFERLEEAAQSPDYLGCPYAATQVELKNPEHPASMVAAQAKQDLVDFFRAEARRGGADDPDWLARQLAVVYDGASTRAGIGADSLRGLAVATADVLLRAAGLTG